MKDPNDFTYSFNPCKTFTEPDECADGVYVRVNNMGSSLGLAFYPRFAKPRKTVAITTQSQMEGRDSTLTMMAPLTSTTLDHS